MHPDFGIELGAGHLVRCALTWPFVIMRVLVHRLIPEKGPPCQHNPVDNRAAPTPVLGETWRQMPNCTGAQKQPCRSRVRVAGLPAWESPESRGSPFDYDPDCLLIQVPAGRPAGLPRPRHQVERLTFDHSIMTPNSPKLSWAGMPRKGNEYSAIHHRRARLARHPSSVAAGQAARLRGCWSSSVLWPSFTLFIALTPWAVIR